MSYIGQNIERINKEIILICGKVGRDPKEIRLIAVTKTVDSDKVNEAILNGVTDIGENRVQEIMDKYRQVKNASWHMIGHLQTNKVKYIIDKVKLIHSLDRINLANEINNRAKQHGLVMDTLVQVNVALEDTKFGLRCDEVHDFIRQVMVLENIKICGLMTIAPYEVNPEDVRMYFKELKCLFEDIKSRNYSGVEMKYLSMGMTNDFKIAIEEGANMIRIGTAIFGDRIYN